MLKLIQFNSIATQLLFLNWYVIDWFLYPRGLLTLMLSEALWAYFFPSWERLIAGKIFTNPGGSCNISSNIWTFGDQQIMWKIEFNLSPFWSYRKSTSKGNKCVENETVQCAQLLHAKQPHHKIASHFYREWYQVNLFCTYFMLEQAD